MIKIYTKMIRIIRITLIFLLSVSPQLFANNTTETLSVKTTQKTDKTITGKIVDTRGEPIFGATIIVQGDPGKGTVTDIDGNYRLTNVPEDAVLDITYIGMQSQSISSLGQTIVNVTLVEDTKHLEELVVVGYGTQKKINLTGSVASINSEKLTIAPIASTSNALTGRIPGLITKQESGLPGGDRASLNIRGFGAPLVIVDGIETEFNNIDANEIESISILKDASAAIYGARAGNGVILVTTKRGNMGKPIISLNSTWTFQGVISMPEICNSGQHAELIREAWLNQGGTEATCRFTQEQIDLYYAGTDPDYPNTDWLKIVARDWAPQQQQNVSIRGGSERVKYFGFFGYLDQQSMFKNNGGEYQRYNLRSNVDAEILKNLNLQIDLSAILENRAFPNRTDQKEHSVWQEYWTTEPIWSPTLPDGRLAYGGASGAIGIHYMTNSELSGYRKTNNSNYKGVFSLKYDFTTLKGLSAKAFVNYERNYYFLKRFSYLSDSWSYNHSNDTYTQQTLGTVPTLLHTDSKNRTLTGQFSLNFDRIFAENHHVAAMALYELIDFYSDWIDASRIGYKTTTIDYLFAGGLSNQMANGSASEMGRQSYIGRVNYSYKAKYLLESTLRIDESAKFSKENRRGYFPSVSLGWRLSEENFLKNHTSILENLKLRVSYSQSGRDAVGNFQYLSGYKYGSKYLIGSTATEGLITTGMANPNLTWEKMTIYNLGLDFSLAKRALYGDVDFFYRNREGIPGTRTGSVPTTFGITLPTENLNSINTRGFEATLGHSGNFNNFQWDINANLSWSRSKYGFYDEPDYEDEDQKRQNKRTGEWTDRSLGFLSDGVFTSQEEIDALDFVYDEAQGNSSLRPGDIRYINVNGDELLDWRDKIVIGKGVIPHWMGGFNIDLRYKNFDLSALFQGAFGFYQQIRLRWGINYSTLIYNERWTPDNNRKDVLVERLGGAASNSYPSDFYYKKADYLRLKIASLGYNLPSFLVNKINIENLRIYVSGTNLFTISEINKYDLDPEAPSSYGGYYYPQMRTITLGLNLTL